MNYYIDTEFIEGKWLPKNWLLRMLCKPFKKWMPYTIQLISIGIVSEDGREYYAVSTDFNPADANEWVKENVLSQLPAHSRSFYDSPRVKEENMLWKSNARIANEVFRFVCPPNDNGKPVFLGYFADYDWVVFCWLFGTMMQLPKHFSMYCRDLKQMMDEKTESIDWYYYKDILGEESIKDRPATFEEKIKIIKAYNKYPQQTNEHNALADARWNKELHYFLNTWLR